MVVRTSSATALRRRVAVAALATLAVTGLPVPSSAATTTTYAVKAARSSYVDLAFARPFTLDMGKSRVTGSGAYAGYYFQPLIAEPDSGHGEVWITEYSYPSFARFALPLGNQDAILTYEATDITPRGTIRRLPAGRYRLHVLGDRSVDVRLVLPGAGASRALTATRPSPFAAAWEDITPAIAGQSAPGAVTADLPITVKSANSLSFLSYYLVNHATEHTVTGPARLCLGSPDQPTLCHQDRQPGVQDPADRGYGYAHDENRVQRPTTVSESAYGFATYFQRNTAFTGDLVAHFEVATPAIIDKVVVAAFSLAY